jgi:hypothetical protein
MISLRLSVEIWRESSQSLPGNLLIGGDGSLALAGRVQGPLAAILLQLDAGISVIWKEMEFEWFVKHKVIWREMEIKWFVKHRSILLDFTDRVKWFVKHSFFAEEMNWNYFSNRDWFKRDVRHSLTWKGIKFLMFWQTYLDWFKRKYNSSVFHTHYFSKALFCLHLWTQFTFGLLLVFTNSS